MKRLLSANINVLGYETRVNKGTPKTDIVPLNGHRNYVVNVEVLKTYLKYGMVLTKIHRGISFKEVAYIEPYVAMNTELRAKAKTKTKKDLHKLAVNSPYRKTLENVRNHSSIHLVNSEDYKAMTCLIRKPNYKARTEYEGSNLVMVNMGKTTVKLNKPVFVGQALLDHSKKIMYQFYYGYVKPKWGDHVMLLMTDTDSAVLEVRTCDFYADIKDDVHEHFNTSAYPKGHPSGIEVGLNGKMLGMMKDKSEGKQIIESVGLRSKMYAFKFEDGTEKKTAKGVPQNVSLNFDHYKKCLFEGAVRYETFQSIRLRKHEITTEQQRKKMLDANDNKHVTIDGDPEHNTLSVGHYSLRDT